MDIPGHACLSCRIYVHKFQLVKNFSNFELMSRYMFSKNNTAQIIAIFTFKNMFTYSSEKPH